MNLLINAAPLAAIGYSLIYLLFGGGFGGAVLIFIVAKMLGKWSEYKWSPFEGLLMNNTARIVLIVVLLLLLLGMLPAWPYSAGFGYYPSGGLGLILLVVVILLLLGKL
jgi:hypothetical protein